MVGFSRTIAQLAQSKKWINTEIKPRKKVKPQTGAGKIVKKRHSTIDVKKCKKPSKKPKIRH